MAGAGMTIGQVRMTKDLLAQRTRLVFGLHQTAIFEDRRYPIDEIDKGSGGGRIDEIEPVRPGLAQ